MSTPLELYALTQMAELDAAQRLIAATTAELWALTTLCHLRLKKSSSKQEIIAAILTVTHPPSTPAAAGQQYHQERFV